MLVHIRPAGQLFSQYPPVCFVSKISIPVPHQLWGTKSACLSLQRWGPDSVQCLLHQGNCPPSLDELFPLPLYAPSGFYTCTECIWHPCLWKATQFSPFILCSPCCILCCGVWQFPPGWLELCLAPLRCLFPLRHNSRSVQLTHLKCTIPPSGFLFKRLYVKLLRKRGHKAVNDPQGSQLGRALDRLLPNLGSSGVLPPWCCFQFWIISGSRVGPLHLVLFLAVLPLAFDSHVDWAEIYTKELFSFRVFPGPCWLRLFCDLCTLSKVPVPGAHPAGSGWCVIWTKGAWAYLKKKLI